MERAVLLVEATGQRISALVNPAHLVRRRLAGLVPRPSLGGVITGPREDPVIVATGRRRTDLELELFFDVDLPGSSIATTDVRDLTGPIWDLAGRPDVVRFVWGKSWNIPALVGAVAERLEQFGPDGVPGRSWLRVRLLEVAHGPVLGGGDVLSTEPTSASSAERTVAPGTVVRFPVGAGT
jgi:hypothetical protein